MELYESNFMFSIAVARLLHFFFWVSSYHELNDKYGDNIVRKYPGHLVVMSQVVNLVVLANFVIHHMGNARRTYLAI